MTTAVIDGPAPLSLRAPWMVGTRFSLGRLPGDGAVERGNVRFYVPLTTSITQGVVVGVVKWFRRRRGGATVAGNSPARLRAMMARRGDSDGAAPGKCARNCLKSRHSVAV